MAAKVLRKGKPDGYRPQRQRVRRVAVVGVSEWTRRAAHQLDEAVRDRPAEVYSIILANPGCRVWHIEQEMGIVRGSIKSLLASMDNYGYLIAEDDDGRLYPFAVVNR